MAFADVWISCLHIRVKGRILQGQICSPCVAVRSVPLHVSIEQLDRLLISFAAKSVRFPYSTHKCQCKYFFTFFESHKKKKLAGLQLHLGHQHARICCSPVTEDAVATCAEADSSEDTVEGLERVHPQWQPVPRAQHRAQEPARSLPLQAPTTHSIYCAAKDISSCYRDTSCVSALTFVPAKC